MTSVNNVESPDLKRYLDALELVAAKACLSALDAVRDFGEQGKPYHSFFNGLSCALRESDRHRDYQVIFNESWARQIMARPQENQITPSPGKSLPPLRIDSTNGQAALPSGEAISSPQIGEPLHDLRRNI